jgi:hypothetical protein
MDSAFTFRSTSISGDNFCLIQHRRRIGTLERQILQILGVNGDGKTFQFLVGAFNGYFPISPAICRSLALAFLFVMENTPGWGQESDRRASPSLIVKNSPWLAWNARS